jgi:hypothetical protein
MHHAVDAAQSVTKVMLAEPFDGQRQGAGRGDGVAAKAPQAITRLEQGNRGTTADEAGQSGDEQGLLSHGFASTKLYVAAACQAVSVQKNKGPAVAGGPFSS